MMTPLFFALLLAAAPPPAPPPIVVQGREARPFTIAPDPALARRYAPRAQAPLNRLVVRF